jgi:hypothetical protein
MQRDADLKRTQAFASMYRTGGGHKSAPVSRLTLALVAPAERACQQHRNAIRTSSAYQRRVTTASTCLVIRGSTHLEPIADSGSSLPIGNGQPFRKVCG